jgi:hypothetical protein
MRFLELGAIGNLIGVEHDHVRFHARAELAAVPQLQPLRRIAGHSAHPFFERQHMLFAHIDTEHASESPVASRVRRGPASSAAG